MVFGDDRLITPPRANTAAPELISGASAPGSTTRSASPSQAGAAGERDAACPMAPAADGRQAMPRGDCRLRARVLVVEDDPSSGRLLQGKLAPDGHEVHVVGTSNGALEYAERWAPDVILSDVYMPGMNGITLTRQLKARPETAAAPVLLVTAMDDCNVLAEGLEAGADDFLTKPVNTLELRTRVRSLLRIKALGDLVRAREKGGSAGTSPARAAGDAPRSAREPAPGQSSVLLVEDNEPESRLLTIFLEQSCFRTRLARDGQSALAALEAETPDVVMLDLLLPDISGYDLIRDIKSQPRFATLPILVISQETEIRGQVRALELGADDFVVKGVKRLELKARVQRLIRLRHYLVRLSESVDQPGEHAGEARVPV